MSHVVNIDVMITDLAAMEQAASDCGMELIRNVDTYRWWGYSVGDYPLPEGFQASDLGKCEHKLKLKGDDYSFEIGLVRRRDGKPGYTMLFDFYGQGKLLQAIGGQHASKLRQCYSKHVALNKLRKQGFKLAKEIVQADGSIRLEVRR